MVLRCRNDEQEIRLYLVVPFGAAKCSIVQLTLCGVIKRAMVQSYFLKGNFMLYVTYPKCTTCQKAKKFLDAHNISYTERNIKEENPTAAEIASWYPKSDKKIERFFNTSGLVYRAENLKDKLPTMSEEEKVAMLATNGMLVKRPILVLDHKVLVGFKEAEWKEALGIAE